MNAEKTLYSTTMTVSGGRNGTAVSEDGTFSLKLTPPQEMGGEGEVGTNPEQLFAAGYAACFQSALGLIARRKRVDASNSTINSTVRLHPNGAGGYKLSVTLEVHLPGVEHALAEQLVEQAHQICPYSNATRGNIDVELRVVTE